MRSTISTRDRIQVSGTEFGCDKCACRYPQEGWKLRSCLSAWAPPYFTVATVLPQDAADLQAEQKDHSSPLKNSTVAGVSPKTTAVQLLLTR